MKPKYWILGEHHETVPTDDIMAWGQMFNDEKRIVAQTRIGDVTVSTVFLGIDHNWSPDGPPLLFETMVFGGPFDEEQERYSTWAEAEAGHAAMVEKVTAAEAPAAPAASA